MRIASWLLAIVGAGVLVWLLASGEGSDPSREAPTSETEAGGAGEAALHGNAPVGTTPEDAPEVTAPDATTVKNPLHASGLVVSPDHKPAAGVQIVAVVEGVEVGRTLTDDAGRFRLFVGPRPSTYQRGTLRLRKGGLGMDRSLFLYAQSPPELTHGTLMLKPIRSLRVRVTRDGEPAAGALVVATKKDAGRADPTTPPVRTDADGLAEIEGITESHVYVFAHVEGRGRGFGEVVLPREELFELALPPDRTITVRVTRGDTQAPVEGAEVHLAGKGSLPFPGGVGSLPRLPQILTDGTGTAVVSGMSAHHIWVVARAPGLQMTTNGMMVERVILQAGENEASVTLWPLRAVRFPISEQSIAIPADGTQLELRRYQPIHGYDTSEPQARVEDGHVVIEPFPPGFDVGHVVAPDGSWATWETKVDADLGEPVRFVPAYDVSVRLTWRDGSPAVGERLWLILSPRGRREFQTTDADGRVSFGRCHAKSAHVMWSPVDHGFGTSILNLNLTSDPGTPTVAIDRPIDIVVQLRQDGAPRLPDTYRLQVPDLSPGASPGRKRVVTARELSEDRDAGEIRFRWLPMPGGDAPLITIEPDGLPPVSGTPTKDAAGVWRTVIDLPKSTTLRVRVEPPEGGRYFLRLMKWHAERGQYFGSRESAAQRSGRRAIDGVHTYKGLEPGRYRIREHHTGIESEPFELVADGSTTDIALDLSGTVFVRGRVVVPEGESPAYARVHVADRHRGSASTMNPVRIKLDGTFEMRARRGERLRLAAFHPTLKLVGEPVEFVVGTDSPVVRLGVGPAIRFTVAGSDFTTAAPQEGMTPHVMGPVRVTVARSVMGLTHAHARTPLASKGRFRIGVDGPGTYVVRIEQHGRVPTLLEGVEIGDGVRDLGEVSLATGATVVVRLLKGKEPIPQHVSVQASLQGQSYSYTASGYQQEAGDPPVIRLAGVGPGTFQLVVKQMMVKRAALHESEFESDGSTTITIDAQLP